MNIKVPTAYSARHSNKISLDMIEDRESARVLSAEGDSRTERERGRDGVFDKASYLFTHRVANQRASVGAS